MSILEEIVGFLADLYGPMNIDIFMWEFTSFPKVHPRKHISISF